MIIILNKEMREPPHFSKRPPGNESAMNADIIPYTRFSGSKRNANIQLLDQRCVMFTMEGVDTEFEC